MITIESVTVIIFNTAYIQLPFRRQLEKWSPVFRCRDGLVLTTRHLRTVIKMPNAKYNEAV